MRYTLPIYLAMAIYACMIQKWDPVGSPGLDKDIAPYVQEFNDLIVKKIGPDVDIPPIDGSIVNLRDSVTSEIAAGKDTVVIGICRPRFDGLPYRMDVDDKYWSKASYHGKKALIFHELGHCILHLPHDDSNRHGTNSPKSLMNSMLLHEYEFQFDEQYYIDELFAKADKMKIGNKFMIFTRPKTMLSSPVPSSPQPGSKVLQQLLQVFPQQPQHPSESPLLHPEQYQK